MLPPPARPRANILIVDDDAGVRDVCTTMLHALGYRAHGAASGEDALDQVSLGGTNQGVDVALVDLRMPGMNGAEVIAALKQLRPDVCVVVMSGLVREDLYSHVDAGADAALRKPFGLEELEASVSTALATREQRSKAA